MNSAATRQHHNPTGPEPSVQPENLTAGLEPTPPLMTELLLLPNGEVLVHNLTPTFADFLARLGMAHDRRASNISPVTHDLSQRLSP